MMPTADTKGLQERLDAAPDDEIVRLLRTMPIPDYLGGGVCKQAADRIAYLSAQEELLQEWQDKVDAQDQRIAELERENWACTHAAEITKRSYDREFELRCKYEDERDRLLKELEALKNERR